MTSRPSGEMVQRLTPLLGSLARLVISGSQLSKNELRTLLFGAGLESEPTAQEEMERWGQLLMALYQQPSEALRRATVEALLLRGLPEAPALLAVTTVIEGTSTTAPSQASQRPRRLKADVERLDFGTLSPGQTASAVIIVSGGPGHVVSESDQVQITPVQFGEQPTRIHVEAKPLSNGLLWTTLKLITVEDTLEVPVIAQWQSLPPVAVEPLIAQPPLTSRVDSPLVSPERPPTIICPTCGQVNSIQEIYCQRCAQQLTGSRQCHHCSRPIPMNALFCTECGCRL